MARNDELLQQRGLRMLEVWAEDYATIFETRLDEAEPAHLRELAMRAREADTRFLGERGHAARSALHEHELEKHAPRRRFHQVLQHVVYLSTILINVDSVSRT